MTVAASKRRAVIAGALSLALLIPVVLVLDASSTPVNLDLASADAVQVQAMPHAGRNPCAFGGKSFTHPDQLDGSFALPVVWPRHPLANDSNVEDIYLCTGTTLFAYFSSGIEMRLVDIEFDLFDYYRRVVAEDYLRRRLVAAPGGLGMIQDPSGPGQGGPASLGWRAHADVRGVLITRSSDGSPEQLLEIARTVEPWP